jgi:hypothetical protein
MWFLAACAPAPVPGPLPEPVPEPVPVVAPVVAPPPPPPAPPVDPGTLPQTEDRPRADDPAFLARLQALVDGAEARSAFFPKAAYVQLKDLPKPADPARDFDDRLLAAYDRDVAALRDRLAGGRVLRIELPEKGIRWIAPGVEYNTIGYWRVKNGKLVVERGGSEVVVPVTSLISWRGQWYVVHLSGMS